MSEKKTLRDEMAIAALTGMLGCWNVKQEPHLLADWAYDYADAMLAVRSGDRYVTPPSLFQKLRKVIKP